MQLNNPPVHNPTPPTERIIRPTSGWQLVNWREWVQYRDLLYFLTIRGIKAKAVFLPPLYLKRIPSIH